MKVAARLNCHPPFAGFHSHLHYLVESPTPAMGREHQPHFTEEIQAQRGQQNLPRPHPLLMMELALNSGVPTLTCTASRGCARTLAGSSQAFCCPSFQNTAGHD